MGKAHSFWKWGVTVAVVAIVFNHFLMTATYLSPPNLLRLKLETFAYTYMNHFFYQSWELFSPNPGISATKLAVRCQSPDGDWTAWEDPMEEMVAKHHRYRISGHGKLLYVYRNIPISLNRLFGEKQQECLDALPEDSEEFIAQCAADQITPQLEETLAYTVAVQHANRVCAKTTGENGFSAAQFKVLQFFPLQYSERDDLNKRWSTVSEVFFQPVAAQIQG